MRSPGSRKHPGTSRSQLLWRRPLLECFQWSDEADRQCLAHEIADVAIYLLLLADYTGIDLEAAILSKLSLNYGREWTR